MTIRSKICGIVHPEDAELAAGSKPAKLAELDAANLDRVITVSSRMMGAVPWRGGTLGLELCGHVGHDDHQRAKILGILFW